MLACAEQSLLKKTPSDMKHLLNVRSLGIIWYSLLPRDLVCH